MKLIPKFIILYCFFIQIFAQEVVDVEELKVYDVDINYPGSNEVGSWIIDIEANRIVNLKLKGNINRRSGYTWSLYNIDDVKRNYDYLVEPLHHYYDKNSDTTYYIFHFKTQNKILPTFVFEYKNGTKVDCTVIAKFIGKSLNRSKCAIDKFPCCKQSNPVVYLTDSLGDWSMENSDWCYIKENLNCFSIALGYPCCKDKNTAVALRDNDGKWGVENGNWCGISK